MPRKARIDASGAVHHVIVRGIERCDIFTDDTDRDNWIARMGKILIETGTPCYAWALMDNHVHLLLRTGTAPLATVMRRLLTGYAVSFNHRHRRHGHLFQNRYKSILCQEDLYLRELVRYIHLNPLRAGIVGDLEGLDRYAYCGHGVLMGHQVQKWQASEDVLRQFHRKRVEARRRYREYLGKGIAEGRREELTGGGLIRSLGGWQALRELGRNAARMKSDERILGDGDFVMEVLRENQERMERKSRFRLQGYDFRWLVGRVAEALDMTEEEVLRQGRYADTVQARSILCHAAHRELCMSTVDLAARLGVSQPTVSQSVQRGERLIREMNLRLFEPL